VERDALNDTARDRAASGHDPSPDPNARGLGSSEPHSPDYVNRKVAKQFRYGNPKRAADPQHDREARDLRAAFEVAGVGGGDSGGFGELFLRPASIGAELAQALPEDLCLDGHVGLIINNR